MSVPWGISGNGTILQNLGGALTSLGLLRRQLGAQDRDDVSFGAWPVTAAAELNADSIITSLTVHRFDDTTEEGAGLGEYLIPAGAVSITFTLESRAQTGPVAPGFVMPKVYYRFHGSDGPYGVPQSATLSVLAFAVASTDWQITTSTHTLTSLGLGPGDIVQFELTRDTSFVPPGPAAPLLGDWTLAMCEVRFD